MASRHVSLRRLPARLLVHLEGRQKLGQGTLPHAVLLSSALASCRPSYSWRPVSARQAVWVTALAPYFVLFALLVQGVQLEGSMEGIKYYLYPQWDKLLKINVCAARPVQSIVKCDTVFKCKFPFLSRAFLSFILPLLPAPAPTAALPLLCCAFDPATTKRGPGRH